MKKIIELLLAAVLVFSLAACGSQTASNDSSVNGSESGVATDESESKTENTSGNKTLIAYFSPANSDTVDAISNATPRVGNISTVEYVAQKIHEQVDADVVKIMPIDPYPTDYDEARDRVHSEADNNERPEFTLDVDVNPEDYDVVFVGYPIWYFQMPMIMNTFFETYDFSGKTIIPFNSHAGSSDGGTYTAISELEPEATVLDGLPTEGESAAESDESIKEWLSGLGY